MDLTLWEWMTARYWVQMILIVLCIIWALFDVGDEIYEPRYIDPNILDSTKWKFAQVDYDPTSVGEEMWHLGINRNLIQLETMKKPTGPLWKSLDSLLDQWEQDLTDFD